MRFTSLARPILDPPRGGLGTLLVAVCGQAPQQPQKPPRVARSMDSGLQGPLGLGGRSTVT